MLAERLLAACAGGAGAAGGGVRGDDAPAGGDVDAAELVPERARRRPEQHGVAAPERLQVGAVGERHLDLHEHVALGLGLGPRHVLEPQVAGPVEDEGPHRVGTPGAWLRARRRSPAAHGTSTTFSARPSRCSASASSNRSSGSTVGSGSSSVGRSATASLHVRRRRRPRPDDRQLPPVHRRRPAASRRRRRAAPSRPARRPRAPRRRRPARTARPRRPARPGAAPARSGCRSTANTVSPRGSSTAPKSRPMNPFPTTSTRPRGTSLAPRSTHASGSTYVPRASSTPGGSSTHPEARTRSAKPPGHDRRLGEPLAGRLVPRAAAAALPAAGVVDQRDAAPVARSSRRPRARARRPAARRRSSPRPIRRARRRATVTSVAGRWRLRDVRKGGSSVSAEDNRAHGHIVGGCAHSRCDGASRCGGGLTLDRRRRYHAAATGP